MCSRLHLYACCFCVVCCVCAALFLKESFVVPNVRKLQARGINAASIAGVNDVIDIDTVLFSKYSGE